MIILRTLRTLLPAFVACVLASTANAQLAATLRLSKKQYLTGEPVMAVVTVTNHAGREITFYGNTRTPWLNFIIKDGRGDDISPLSGQVFGKMTIKAGETLAREVNLGEHFLLGQSGNFSAVAVIRMPNDVGEGTSTNRVLFTQAPGSTYWTQKVGIPGNNEITREFRLLTFSGDQKTQLYAQVNDGKTGQSIRTFLLGDVVMINRPIATVDRQQRLHVMFLANPSTWVHQVITTDGKTADRQFHRRAEQGDPRLVSLQDGSVRVGNSIPYDPKAAAEAKSKVRKASDRPAITY